MSEMPPNHFEVTLVGNVRHYGWSCPGSKDGAYNPQRVRQDKTLENIGGTVPVMGLHDTGGFRIDWAKGAGELGPISATGGNTIRSNVNDHWPAGENIYINSGMVVLSDGKPAYEFAPTFGYTLQNASHDSETWNVFLHCQDADPLCGYTETGLCVNGQEMLVVTRSDAGTPLLGTGQQPCDNVR